MYLDQPKPLKRTCLIKTRCFRGKPDVFILTKFSELKGSAADLCVSKPPDDLRILTDSRLHFSGLKTVLCFKILCCIWIDLRCCI